MHGIIPLYKPKGLTSHDCVMKVRKLLKIKKVGHTGTLDPNVEGVLPICVGEATKIIPFLLSLKKVYIADVYLGKATTTEDQEGEIISEKEVIEPLEKDKIDQVLKTFVGDIKQKPPMYSAVKVKGRRLYEYAFKNIEIERPERKVTIYNINRITMPDQIKHNPFRIRVECSKGTYIRTLCVDIGKMLGYPAHMSYLQRVESDSITLSETVTFKELNRAFQESEISKILLPMKSVLKHLDILQVNKEIKKKVLHGQKLPLPKKQLETDPFLVMYENTVLAIYEKHKENSDLIKPIRVFNILNGEGESNGDDKTNISTSAND